MQKWEYLIVRIMPDDKTMLPGKQSFTDGQLESVGNEGWEMVAVVPYDKDTVNAFFKRPRMAEGEPRVRSLG
jgi:hypothetical protein